MGDGTPEGAPEAPEARAKEARGRIPDLRGRIPDLKERGPELRERGAELTARSAEELKTRGAELRSKSTELRNRGGELARQYAKMDVAWARCGYARALREGLLSLVLGPMTDWYIHRRTVGRDVFDDLTPPVVFVANHSSHLDTPTILRAIPRAWRDRTAVAAAADYFYQKRWTANGVALLFNTVPLGRTGGGLAGGAMDHVDRLIGQRWNLLMFPEGTRSRDGRIGKVRSGAAVIAANHDIDVVPIYVGGTHDAMPPGQSWPRRRPGPLVSRRHEVVVRFGAPIRPRAEQSPREVMDAVRAFWEREGLPEEGDATAVPAHDVLLMHRALEEYEARHPEPARRFERRVPVAHETPEHRPSPAA
jgi:1-acyl-sn-glycerol-3-phosphate acyltransferase